MTAGSSGATSTAGQSSGGSSVAGAGSNIGGTAGGGGTSTGGGDSGTSGSGGSGGGAADPSHYGQITFINQLSANRVSANASFVASQSGSSACTGTQTGACWVSTCGDGASLTTTNVDAGTITITGSQIGGSAVLEPDAMSQYSMVVNSTLEHLFLGGETASFKASGGEVPAFEVDVPSPLILLLSTPLYVKGTSQIDAPRSQDLSLTWSRGKPGVVLYLTAASARPDGQPGRVSMTCQLPSETGSAVLETALLQQFAPDTTLTAYTVATKNLTAGDYTVIVGFVTGVGNPDKVIIPNIQLH